MAGSGSYARGDRPRSVPDPDAARHEAAARQQRAYNKAQEAALSRKTAAGVEDAKRLGDRIFPPASLPDMGRIDHPGEMESWIPIWGPGREALADRQDGDLLGALGNGVLAASDVVPAKAVAGSLLKGAVKVGGPHVWRTKPWEKAQGVRQWLGEKGYLKPGEHGHHWAIPQNGWGKSVPEWLKNQPWDIKGLDAVTHGRVHGPYTVGGVRLPKFNLPQRIWYGTPDWWKAMGVSGSGRLVPPDSRRDQPEPRGR